jgi:aryl-alcohol dehydrogenase-like predicted oxidoreductase
MRGAVERHRPQLQAYEALCARIGEQPADVAPAWLLRNPVLSAVIVGPRTPEQLAASRRALDVTLSDDTLRTLDEIWPGPGGEAPEAYAW